MDPADDRGTGRTPDRRPGKPKVLIGFLSKTIRGPIPSVTRSFMLGLGDRYEFFPVWLNRGIGTGKPGALSPANITVLFKHLLVWVSGLLRHRPAIAHYPVTSGWNLEKSLVFLRIARLLGSATVGHLHGGIFDRFWEELSPRRRRIAGRLLRSLDVLVVLSEGWRTWSAQHLPLPGSQVMVVRNPIDQSFERAANNLEVPGPPSVLFLGALGRRKGVFDILEAAEKLQTQGRCPAITLVGPEELKGEGEQVRGEIVSRKLVKVSVRSPVYDDARIELFRSHGVLVLPSYYENLPLVVLEAAAAGRAIVTTVVGGLPEFFADGDSVLFVERGNVPGLAETLHRVTADPSLRERLGRRAREAFQTQFARPLIMGSLDNVYRVAGAARGSAGGRAKRENAGTTGAVPTAAQ